MYTPENPPANRREQTLKEVVALVMKSPISDAQVSYLDGVTPMSALKSMNVDVQTAIVARFANQAMGGDVKSFEVLMKAGGLEPPKEQKITVDLPTFYTGVDDLPADIKAALAEEVAIAIDDSKEEDAAVDVQFEVLPPEENSE
jgi:hypothetical protein